MSNPSPFKWRHFESDIILLCVRWYLRYSLSYRDLEEMMLERGLPVDHTTIYRWVQRSAPELDKRCRPHLKACNDPGEWTRRTSSEESLDVSLPSGRFRREQPGVSLESERDAEAAKRFFVKALHSTACSAPQARPVEEQVAQPTAASDPNTTKSAPRVINVDKNAAYPKAMADLKAAGVLPQRSNSGRSNT